MVILLAGFMSVLSVHASSPAAVSAKNIRQKFVNAVMNPSDNSTVPTKGEVEVLFTVMDDGKIDIKKIKSTNEDATKYVKEKVSDLTCSEFTHPYNQYYKVKFRFQED